MKIWRCQHDLNLVKYVGENSFFSDVRFGNNKRRVVEVVVAVISHVISLTEFTELEFENPKSM